MRNPLKRQPGTASRKPLRERFAALTKAVTGRAHSADAEVDAIAAMHFEAYDLAIPLKSPRAWSDEFAGYALAMHIADRVMRMGKAELAAFIRGVDEKDHEAPKTMLEALDGASETLDGWSKLLGVARSRYIVAACAAARATDPAPASV